MQTDLILAGFGGQGIMLIGKILAYSGMKEGKEVSWLPSYGPEMRGGTANCTVVISDNPVGSPIVRSPRVVLVMNRPSMDKFEPMLRSEGVLLVNSSLIDIKSERNDIQAVYIPANEIAIDCGTPKAANMAALGALLGKTGIVKKNTVEKTIEEQFASKKGVVEINKKALNRGYRIGKGGKG